METTNSLFPLLVEPIGDVRRAYHIAAKIAMDCNGSSRLPVADEIPAFALVKVRPHWSAKAQFRHFYRYLRTCHRGLNLAAPEFHRDY